jgi:hypothetical protein
MNPPVPELQDSRLYDLLEAAAEQGPASIRLLGRFLGEGGRNPVLLDEPVASSAKLADAIRDHLLRATVTSLPKADFEVLARTIAAIPVASARFAQRFALAADSLGRLPFAPALEWVEELTEILVDTVRQLRGFESLDRIKELHLRLQTVAERAETQVQTIVGHAYEHPTTPLDPLKIKDAADQLVAIIDCCREASSQMNGISLQFL